MNEKQASLKISLVDSRISPYQSVMGHIFDVPLNKLVACILGNLHVHYKKKMIYFILSISCWFLNLITLLLKIGTISLFISIQTVKDPSGLSK